METAGKVNEKCKGKATLKKDLLKKVDDLSTFCNVEAAVVIYSPGENHPTVWPHPTGARATISKFLARTEPEKIENSETSMCLLKKESRKKKEEVKRSKMENKDRTVQLMISSIYDGKLSFNELESVQNNMLRSFADKRKEELNRYIQKLKKEQEASSSELALLPCSNPAKSSSSFEFSCKMVEKGN